jgi:membrane dipeptidase
MPESKAISRRNLLAAGGAVAIGFPLINRGSFAFAAAPSRTYSARAVGLMRETLVIDMLAPLSLNLDPKLFDRPFTDEQKAQFRASGITGFHNSFGLGGFTAKEDAFEYLAAWQGYLGAQADLFSLVRNPSDLEAAKAAGKAAVIMGLQNADQFEKPEDVAQFYRLGLRCAQLTYNSQNFIGSGSTDRVDGGVSDFGVSIIRAMNEAGMLVDVSHCGDRTTLDGIDISPKPIAITHSNCRSLARHPRSKTDEAIRKLAAKGGVMGITGVRNFVRETEPTNIRHLADHIDHVVKIAGIEHVGIGSDADLNGYDDMDPKQYAELKAAYKSSYAFRGKLDTDGFDHPMKFFDLTDELIRRGYSDGNIRLILGGNFRRLLGVTWL